MRNVAKAAGLALWILTALGVKAGTVLVDDPLTTGSSAGDVHGGTFTSKGWQTTKTTDYIEYRVPTISKGWVEFDLSGWGPDTSIFTDFKNHFFGMWDASWKDRWGNVVRYNPYKCLMRAYGEPNVPNNVKWGRLKLRLNVAAFDGGADDDPHAFEALTEERWDWKTTETYHFRLEWGDGHMRWYKDGQLIMDYDYSSFGVEYAPPDHVIRIGYCDMYPAPVGTVYSNVRIYTENEGSSQLSILSTTPADGATGVPTSTSISLRFSKSMNTSSVESHFSISPQVDGTFNWNSPSNTQLTFTPSNNLEGGTTYTVTLAAGAAASDGEQLMSDQAFSFTTGSTAGADLVSVPAYSVFEIELTSSNSYDNPYLVDPPKATFTAPSGKTFEIEGFWDGGNTWRVRFAPTQTGTWSFSIRSEDPDLAGGGQFQCTPSSSHGFVRVSATNPYTFEYDDGTPFFWLGETSWRGLTDQVPFDSRFKQYIDLRASQGFTHVHFILNSYINGLGFWKNEGGTVFDESAGSKDYDRLNPGYFKWVDRRLDYVESKGLVPGLYLTWAQEFVKFSPEQFERFVHYVVARYAAYNITWTVSGEYDEAGDKRAYAAVGNLIKQLDPYNHPVTIQPSADGSSAEFAGNDWLDYIAEQVKSNWHDAILRDRQYNKPVVNEEYGYAGKVSAQDVVRGAWSIVTAGGFFTAGFLTTYAPDKGGWDLNAYLPEAQALGFLRNVLEKLPWWEMEPHDELLTRGYCLAKPGEVYLAYIPGGGTFGLRSPGDATYQVAWLDPFNASAGQPQTVSGDAARSLTPPFSGDAAALILVSGGGESPSSPSPQPQPGSLITNISPSSYQVRALEVGQLVYVDRDYVFTQVPEDLRGQAYISTANDDKTATGDAFLSFEINQGSDVYVGYDSSVPTTPGWLSSWTKTLKTVQTSDTVFELYRKYFPAGTVTLGANEGDVHSSMYVVVVVPGSGQSSRPDTTPPAPPTGLVIRP